MKKIFSFVIVAFAAIALNAKGVSLNFANADSIQSYGIDLPDAGAGTNLSGTPFTVDGITFSCVKNASNDTRIWNGSGKYSLRTYAKNTITLTSDGENIAGIDVTMSQGSFNELTNGSWVGDAKSVTLTCTSTAYITQIKIYTGQAPVVTIDTFNVAQMNALIDAAPNKKLTKKACVIGRVGAIYAGGIAQYGNINVWLGDIRTANATDTIEAYGMLNYNGVKYTDETEIQFGVGDTIVVYSASWEYFSDDKNQQYEASRGCYLAEVVGPGHPAPIVYEEVSVAEALEIAQALNPAEKQTISTSVKYDVRGYVASLDYRTYYLSDDPKATNGEFQAYKCEVADGDTVKVGSFVSVTGYISNYNGGSYNSYEINQGKIKVLDAPVPPTPTVPTVANLSAAGYNVTNSRVICIHPDEQVCNPIVWAGTYNNWNINPADMLHFQALAGFDGWYVVEVNDASSELLGKPVQLKLDGSFAWDFQSGDADAWINMNQSGTQTAVIYPTFDGEADCQWPDKGAYIYKLAYWKKHNTPCVDKPKHDYTISAYLPEFCDEIAAYADSVRVMGGFDGWTDGIWMELKYDEDFNEYYYAELKDVEEGTEYKLRFGTDGDWAVQVQLNGVDLGNMKMDATTDVVLRFDGEGYSFKACAAPVEYKYTTYENWQLKHEGSVWQWTDNLVKVEEGLFKLVDADWTGSGFNIKSDENPIKQDWFAPEELVVLDGVIAPATVDVYLRVIDDETVAIGVGADPAPVPPTPTVPTVANLSAAGYDVTNSRVICIHPDEEVCNPIVWVGTYQMSGDEWVTDPEVLSTFAPLAGFDGWYVVAVIDNSASVMGKPVQLKLDGSFAWDFQSGDVDAWINMNQPGTQTAFVTSGYDGEANCQWPNKGAYIYELAYWKKHNTPCVDKPKHDYTFTVYMPKFCEEIAAYADSVFILGDFDWNKGVKMEKKFDMDGNAMYYVELDGMEEGTEYKFRCGTMNWDVQPQLNGLDLSNMMMDATTDVVLHFDGEGYGFAICPEQVYLTVNSNDDSRGVTMGDGSYDKGAEVLIVAAATSEDYVFDRWNDNNKAAARYVTVSEDIAYTAYFVPRSSETCIEVASNDEMLGLAVVAVMALPINGGTFLYWDDGVTENPRIVNELDGTLYTAIFTTSIPTHEQKVESNDGQAIRKIIKNDRLYIIRNGIEYIATGARVK